MDRWSVIKDDWFKNHGSLVWKSRIADPKIKEGWSKNQGSLIKKLWIPDPKIKERWSENQGSLIQKSRMADPKIIDRWSYNHESLNRSIWKSDEPSSASFLSQHTLHIIPPHSSPISSHPFHLISLFSISSLIPLPSHHTPLSSLSPVTPALYLIYFSSSLYPQLCPPHSCLSPFPSSRSLFYLIPLLSHPSPLSSLSPLIPLPFHPSPLSSVSPLLPFPLSSLSPLCCKTIFITKNKKSRI